MLRSQIMAGQNVTMQDIARRAKVHVSTVSRALSNDPRINPAVRESIQQIARDLGYRPNPLVSALIRSRRSPRGEQYHATLAYVTKFPADCVADRRKSDEPMLEGARECATRHGYLLEEFNVCAPEMSPKRFTEILHARGIHGIILPPLHSTQDTLGLDWSTFSTVAIGFSQREAKFTRVSHNHFGDAILAFQKCRELGYRRIGLALPRRVNDKVEKRWLGAYLLDQEETASGQPIPPLILEDYNVTSFRDWFQRHRPEVVACTQSAPILRLLEELRLAVPRDVGVVSVSQAVGVPCAGVSHDLRILGTAAVDTLIGALHRNEYGIPANPYSILLNGTWCDGATLPARSGGRGV